jgi:hypothetical protein
MMSRHHQGSALDMGQIRNRPYFFSAPNLSDIKKPAPRTCRKTGRLKCAETTATTLCESPTKAFSWRLWQEDVASKDGLNGSVEVRRSRMTGERLAARVNHPMRKSLPVDALKTINNKSEIWLACFSKKFQGKDANFIAAPLSWR